MGILVDFRMPVRRRPSGRSGTPSTYRTLNEKFRLEQEKVMAEREKSKAELEKFKAEQEKFKAEREKVKALQRQLDQEREQQRQLIDAAVEERLKLKSVPWGRR